MTLNKSLYNRRNSSKMMRMLTDVETLQLKNDPTIYFKGLIVDGSKSKSVVLAKQQQQY
ncbi:hypothetical protein OKW24_003154 [Peribacillus simplex]|nr:hypothetical protein [Peribacillus simplex]